MNKKYLIGVLAAFVIAGCGSKEKTYVEGETAFCTGEGIADVFCTDEDKKPITGIVKSIKDSKSVEMHLKDGKPNGLMQHYENGKLIVEVDYKNENNDVLVKSFYENGNVHIEESFKDGKRNGLFKTYDEEGKVIIEGNHKNDMLDGIIKSYDKNGNVIKEENYVEGVFVE